jgi:hypothetical protein
MKVIKKGEGGERKRERERRENMNNQVEKRTVNITHNYKIVLELRPKLFI